MRLAKSLHPLLLALLAVVQVGCKQGGHEVERIDHTKMAFSVLLPLCITPMEEVKGNPATIIPGKWKAQSNIFITNLDTNALEAALDSIVINLVIKDHQSNIDHYELDFLAWKPGYDMHIEYGCEGWETFSNSSHRDGHHGTCQVDLELTDGQWEGSLWCSWDTTIVYPQTRLVTYSAKPPYTKTIKLSTDE